ncbi:metallopeptidase TldD-related protein [Pseudonocardia eucalypti]|uniref:Metallopeptidase TldD-related protein n=1 Tax=Pseudonocardia eucalypti TaxID=648755 RepID=A0ABP9PHK4_9PSEU
MRAQDLVERALAVPGGADTAGRVVVVNESSEAVLRWANNTMTTNGHSTALSWAVIAFIRLDGGTAAGVVSSSAQVSDPQEIETTVRAAEAAARQAGPARDVADLPEPGDGNGDGWADPAGETSIAVYARLAEELAEGFGRGKAEGRILYGFASHEVTTTWLGTSTGVRRRWTQPTGSVELNAKTADLARSAWGGRSTPTAGDYAALDLLALDAELATRLSWGERRVDLPAGRYDTVLPPSAMADLLTYMCWEMVGRPAEEGRSAFAKGADGIGGIGERITQIPVSMTSDPFAPGLETAPFLVTTHSSDEVSVFDNGAPLRRVDWLRDGVVNALAYPRAAAKEFGAEFTVPGDNLLVSGGGPESTAELVRGVERGLLLTCLWYIRMVEPATLLVTGLTRDGVYLVENGEVVGEVNNFRFNESPLDLLRRAQQVGASERTLPREFKDWFTRTVTAPVRVPDFNMASVSQAT